jgi:hypothetical protein
METNERQRIADELDGLRDELRAVPVHSGSMGRIATLARRIEVLERSLDRVDTFAANIRRLADRFHAYRASLDAMPAPKTWSLEARSKMVEMNRIRGELSRTIRAK